MDENTFSRLVLEHQDMLFRVAYTFLHHPEDCRDTLQDALIKAWKSIHTLRRQEAFRSWMIRIVVNCSKDVMRKRGQPTTQLNDDMVAEIKPEDEALDAALERLDEGLRLPIILFYMEGFSVQEIAHGMRVSSGTVKNRLHRGRKQLAITLNEFEKEDEAWI